MAPPFLFADIGEFQHAIQEDDPHGGCIIRCFASVRRWRRREIFLKVNPFSGDAKAIRSGEELVSQYLHALSWGPG